MDFKYVLTIEEFNTLQLALVVLEFQGSFMQTPTKEAKAASDLYKKLRDETEDYKAEN